MRFRDLVATADLPPHNALFSLQLLDLTNRWWAAREDLDIDIHDVHLSQPQSTFTSSCIPRGILIRSHFSFQTARSLTDLFTAIAALLAGRQPHNAPLLHSARTVHEVVAEEYRIVETFELGTYTPGDWVKLFEVRFCLVDFSNIDSASRRRLVHFSRASPLSVTTSETTHSRPSRIGSSAWFLSCVFAGSVSSRPGFTGDKAALASVRFLRHKSSRTPHAFVSYFPFSVCVKPGASPSHFSTSAWTCQLA